MKKITLYSLSLPAVIAAVSTDEPVEITFRIMSEEIQRHPALGLYDFIKMSSKTPNIHFKFDLMGVMSQHGLLIMLAVEKKNRRVSIHSAIHISKDSSYTKGSVDEILKGAESAIRVIDRVALNITSECDITRPELDDWIKEDKYLDRDELAMFDILGDE